MDSLFVPILAVSAGLVFFGGWVVFIVWLIRRSRRTVAEAQAHHFEHHAALTALGAVPQASDEHGERWTFRIEERQLEARKLTASKSPPVYSLVAMVEPSAELALQAVGGPFRAPVATPRLPPIVLRRETARDRIGKMLGINREWQLQDPGFDDHVYIETEARDDEVAYVLTAPGVRTAVLGLLARGATRVAFADAHGPVLVQWVGPMDVAGFGPGGVAGAARELAALARAIPSVGSVEPARGLGRGGRWILANGSALGVGIVTVVVGKVWFQPFDHAIDAVSVWFGVAAGLAMTVLTLLAVRGTATGLRSFGWSTVLALSGFPLLAVGGARTVNGAFSAPPKTRAIEVIDSHVSSSGKSTSYFVTLAPFGRFKKPLSLSVSSREFAAMRPGERVRVRVGPGALGYPYFAGLDKR